MRDFLAGSTWLALTGLLAGSLMSEPDHGAIGHVRADMGLSAPCDSLGGTDYCECLAHPEACAEESPGLYAQLWAEGNEATRESHDIEEQH